MSHDNTESTDQVEDKLYGLLAEYESPGALIEAAREVRKAGYTKFDCHSPFPVHGIDPAMGIKPTILPWLTFGAGAVGLGLAILMQTWMNNWDYPFNVGGKPLISLPMQIPIAFEVTVLLAAFATFFGMWGLNKLPQVWHPLFGSDRFLTASSHAFFVAIEAGDPKFDDAQTRATLEEAGATNIEEVRYQTSKSHRALPNGVIVFIILSTCLALVPFAYIYKQRASKSDQPHYHIIPNMDFQEKNKPQTASSIFADGRAERVPVEGSVARGELKDDDHLYRGLQQDQWATEFPKEIPLTAETMDRGENRYEIFCSPCHGLGGDGQGMINVRADRVGATATGWVAPSNITQKSFATQPHGQLFNTITHGIRSMPGYATQIKESDRWAIVFYLRALQRSAHSTAQDVPAGQRPAIR
jgi:mono/diheme cytochrome c family protein